jgi:hypothetical protein
MKLIMQFPPISCHMIPLRSKYSLQHPVLKLSVYVPPLMLKTKFLSHPYRTTGKIIVLYILIFMFSDSKREDKRFWTEW